MTPFTIGTFSRSFDQSAMASLTLRSSSFAPVGAVISTVAVASAASGKVTFSWFSALVELAPGTSKVSLKWPPMVRARPANSTITTVQPISTRPRNR